jgi:hypothetical protein
MQKLYDVYGVGIVLFLLYVQMFGYSFADVDEVPKVPRTVRDNPGAYRSHYHSHVRYSGGK